MGTATLSTDHASAAAGPGCQWQLCERTLLVALCAGCAAAIAAGGGGKLSLRLWLATEQTTSHAGLDDGAGAVSTAERSGALLRIRYGRHPPRAARASWRLPAEPQDHCTMTVQVRRETAARSHASKFLLRRIMIPTVGRTCNHDSFSLDRHCASILAVNVVILGRVLRVLR